MNEVASELFKKIGLSTEQLCEVFNMADQLGWSEKISIYFKWMQIIIL